MKYIISCLFILLAAGCVKDGIDKNDALKGNSTISGRVKYVDKYNGRGEEKLFSARRVYISSTPTDMVSFNYFVKTDAQGYFTFENLVEGASYDLFVIDSIDKVLYAAVLTVKPPDDAVVIIAENDVTKQNGILLQVTDAAAQPVTSATISLYNNKQIFDQDTANTQGMASIVADAYGRALFYNVKPGAYFVRGRGAYGGKRIEGTTSFSFDGKGISTPFPLTLLAPLTDVMVTTKDAAGGIVPNASFCVFNNQQLFNTSNCSGSILSSNTVNDGTAILRGLPVGTYYILAQATYQNILYKGTQQVTVTGLTPPTAVVVMQKANPTLNITVKDESGFPVSGATVYLFTSKAVFDADVDKITTGFVKSLAVNDLGVASFQDLTPGTYFIRVKAVFGNLFLVGSDQVDINPGDIKNQPPVIMHPK